MSSAMRKADHRLSGVRTGPRLGVEGRTSPVRRSPDVGLQPRLLLVVLQQEGQVLGPAVFEASRQVHVDAVLREGRVEVRVKVPRVLCGQETRSDAASAATKAPARGRRQHPLRNRSSVSRTLHDDPKLR